MNLRRMVFAVVALTAFLTIGLAGAVVGQQIPAPIAPPSAPLEMPPSKGATPKASAQHPADTTPSLPPIPPTSPPPATAPLSTGLTLPSGVTPPTGSSSNLAPLTEPTATTGLSAIEPSENPTCRQEPAVCLEWIGPPTARLGQPTAYQILVRNTGGCPVHQVTVRNRIPAGVTVQATEPKGINEGTTWIWDLGTLQPRQERRIDLALLPDTRGDLACEATVTFSGTTTARLRIREPKLVVKATGPDKVLLGENATVTLTVSNPGDGIAEQVRIHAVLPDGLEHHRGKAVDFDLRNLGPNESRSVQLVCITKSAGEQKCEVTGTAEGNLSAKDTAVVNVVLPRLDLAVTGPHLRYLDRHAVYLFKITNPGSAPASNVSLSDQVPTGFKFVSATSGGRHDFATRTVSWFIGDLAPGQSHEVSLDVLATGTGDQKHTAVALAARGIKTETEIVTRVEGLPALLMEMVDLDDPVEVGTDTAYEIRITNTGSKTETNLQLICMIPDKMEFRGAVGAAGTRCRLQGHELIFEPLPKLAPRADAIFRINVRGVAPGDLRFRARITSDGLTEPVLKEESTKVYGDEPPQTQAAPPPKAPR